MQYNTNLVGVWKQIPTFFTLFGINEIGVEDGAVFGYIFCKGEESILFEICADGPTGLENLPKFGIQLQIGFGNLKTDNDFEI